MQGLWDHLGLKFALANATLNLKPQLAQDLVQPTDSRVLLVSVMKDYIADLSNAANAVQSDCRAYASANQCFVDSRHLVMASRFSGSMGSFDGRDTGAMVARMFCL